MKIVNINPCENTLDDIFYDSLTQVAMYIDDALTLFVPKHEPPRCASCGATKNLTAGYAGGNEISYCPRCKRDEEMR